MEETRHRRLRILVVEDNDDIREIIKDLLDSAGYNVYTARDGESGLACIQHEDYDLMITDLGLPGLSGWELAKASKRYQANMPVLAISSWQGKDAIAKISEYGIVKVIWKPFRLSKIEETIKGLQLSPVEEIPLSEK